MKRFRTSNSYSPFGSLILWLGEGQTLTLEQCYEIGNKTMYHTDKSVGTESTLAVIIQVENAPPEKQRQPATKSNLGGQAYLPIRM